MTTALDRRTFAAVSKRARKHREPPKTAVQWAHDRGIHWWSAQRAIAESVETQKRTAVRAGHGVGKSYTAAGLAGWWIDTHPGGLVVSSAPSSHQVHGILWEEIRGLHATLGLPGRVLQNDTWMIGGRQAGFGRKPPDAAKGSDFDPSVFQGYHRPGGILVILDEAGGLPEWLWTAAETITTTDNSRILAIGNPDNAGSHFAKVCTPGHPGWRQYKIAVHDSPNFTGEPVPREVAAALVTQAWESDRRDEWGTDNPFYVSKVLAEFPQDHPQQVVPLAALMACRLAEPRALSELVPVELGVDVGGGGDLTVVRERCGMRAGRRWAGHTPEPEQAVTLIKRALAESRATSVKIDAIGVGWGLAGDVRRIAREFDWEIAVHSVKVSKEAHDPVRFPNLRSELWWMARELSQQQAWDLSVAQEADTVLGELVVPRWKPDPAGRVQVEKKEDTKARTGGKSPDDADALLLAYYVPRDAQGAYWEALTSGKLGLWTRAHGRSRGRSDTANRMTQSSKYACPVSCRPSWGASQMPTCTVAKPPAPRSSSAWSKRSLHRMGSGHRRMRTAGALSNSATRSLACRKATKLQTHGTLLAAVSPARYVDLPQWSAVSNTRRLPPAPPTMPPAGPPPRPHKTPPPSPEVSAHSIGQEIGDALALRIGQIFAPIFTQLATQQTRPACLICAAQAKRDHLVAVANAKAAAEDVPPLPPVTQSFTDGARGPVCWGCFDPDVDGPFNLSHYLTTCRNRSTK